MPKHPVEAELAKKLLEPFRSAVSSLYPETTSLRLNARRTDELEMRIGEALVKAHEAGVYDANRTLQPFSLGQPRE